MDLPQGGVLPPPRLPDGQSGGRSPEKHQNLVRFQSDLEFVQCLANPMYLHELANQGILSQPEMHNYLKYLEYWRSPEYVRFIVYPTCLVFLTLVQQELFRNRLTDINFIQELVRVGQKHHETWRVEKPPTTTTAEQEKPAETGTKVEAEGKVKA